MKLVGCAPSEVAADYRQAVAALTPSVQELDLAILDEPGTTDYRTYYAAYRQDVLGVNGNHTTAYERGVQATLQEFTELTPDAPVRLGVGVLDGICHSCAFQHHCQRITPKGNENDRSCLEVFRFIAKRLNIPTLTEHQDEGGALIYLDTDAASTRAVAAEVADKAGNLETAVSGLAIFGDPFMTWNTFHSVD